MKLSFKLIIIFLALMVGGTAFGVDDFDPELCFHPDQLDNYQEEHSDEAYEEILEKCDEYLGNVQQEYEKDIERTEEEKRDLANQIARLENRMAQLDQQIRQSEVRIQELESEIGNTQETISNLNQEIETSQERLAEILVTVNRENNRSTLEILVEKGSLSDFFNDITALEVLSEESQNILEDVREHKNSLKKEENRLEEEVEAAQKEAERQALLKQERQSEKSEHERLYGLTEEEYNEKMEQKEIIEKRAEKIRDRQLALVGLPEDEVPSFGEALEVARWVEGVTGIRPALLLAIVTQESHLGRNVGECYLTDADTGAGRRVGGGRVTNLMATPPQSSRDDPEKFLKITELLDKDPYNTPVSCPFQVGYGGAMGPAQFIPTTWWEQREDIKAHLGKEPSPWRLKDAFLASGTYLANLGGRQNERTAALRYYAGSNWNAPRNAFYGDQVMKRVECLQTFIDHETMSQECSELVFIPED